MPHNIEQGPKVDQEQLLIKETISLFDKILPAFKTKQYGERHNIVVPEKVFSLPARVVEKWKTIPLISNIIDDSPRNFKRQNEPPKEKDPLFPIKYGARVRLTRFDWYHVYGRWLDRVALAPTIELQIKRSKKIYGYFGNLNLFWVYDLKFLKESNEPISPDLSLTKEYLPSGVRFLGPMRQVVTLDQLEAFRTFLEYISDKKPVNFTWMETSYAIEDFK